MGLSILHPLAHPITASSAPAKGFVWQKPSCASNPIVSWCPRGPALAAVGETEGDVVSYIPVFDFLLSIFSLSSVAASAENEGAGNREIG